MKRGMRKKIKGKLKRVFALLMVLSMCSIYVQQVSAIITGNLPVSYLSDEFPESYQPYIDALKAAHPNWIFKAVYTNVDWNLALTHESYEVNPAISLINRNDYGEKWLYQGSNVSHDGPYYTASKEAVAYFMDPRNFLTEVGVFQFETQSYSDSVHSVEGTQKILAATPMGKDWYSTRYKKYGEWIEMSESYAEIIVRLSKKYNISPTHVASRIRQENSGDIVNGALINGDCGYYNFFNIGATPGSDGNSSVTNGINTAINNGWDTPEKSIEAGIQVLIKNYIQYGQDTAYFQKFDVNNPYGNADWLFASQYMTNIAAPSGEASITYNGYVNSGLLESAIEFHIPVYNNMPASASPSPDVATYPFEDDYTRVYLDDPSDTGVVDEFWIRSEPETYSDSNIIQKYFYDQEGQDNRTKLIRIGKGINIPWAKVLLPDGRIGYVNSKWVYEYQYADVTGVSLDQTEISLRIGESTTLNATVSPINAISTDVTWSSQNSEIASVDGSGNIQAKQAGTTQITVTTSSGGKTATCQVTVLPKAVESITLEQTEYEIMQGDVLTLQPVILPEDAGNKNYVVEIEDESILENQDGVLIGKNPGSTKITLRTEDQGKTVEATVTVKASIKVENIIVDPVSTSLKVGESIQINATIEPIQAALTQLVWRSEQEEIASVDEQGNVQAKQVGKTTIYVSTRDQSVVATCQVEVLPIPVESIDLEKTEYTMLKGDILTINPVILPQNATNQNYDIIIEDETILELQDKNLVGKNQGTTEVTFVTQDGKKEVKAKITVLDEIVIDNTLQIDQETGYITKVQPETTVQQMKQKIQVSSSYEQVFLNVQGEEIKEEQLVGTGTKVQIKQDGEVKLEYTILIYGDVNGDGLISSSDYLIIKDYIMSNYVSEHLTGVKLITADVNKDHEVKSSDYLIIKNYIMEDKDLIKQ